eukprot:scaffold301739_cov27-Prasinocladus_malaysianus.AAC.1
MAIITRIKSSADSRQAGRLSLRYSYLSGLRAATRTLFQTHESGTSTRTVGSSVLTRVTSHYYDTAWPI